MARLKLKNPPKKPKSSASVATIRNYFQKLKEVNAYNAALEKEEALRQRLLKQVRTGKVATVSGPRRKKSTAKKSAKKKSTKRRRK